ncbi:MULTISPECIES: ABC transporter permease [Vibrio]|jgi:peptide/nickel transport system permease protein|uniref:ABC transporter permease n=3 Tax=Vibrio TaxID=662 RepID=A0A0H0YC41_VIBAL|nr:MULTISPECIES: ABC transporter permease [Vibrio]EEZ82685.1 peptide ABC transporter, permease protein [Vibrio alginolyticus 40B]MDW1810271.1 ABC transporter permease [Vibrio sp. Vb2362]MDW2258296.1 ABC transporter permease [Vibrio sp. 1409]MDW2295064.1 ABC transporter permease [Vibrio sp. 1404]NAW96624.1 ABC transporter permease subunit [Vibrio sp. V42_P2S4T144]QCO87011.1 ABC transporter permease [Vibrio neocaledonicus]QIR89475.1 ABC transporter permease subunit [Vibrio diabolicus]
MGYFLRRLSFYLVALLVAATLNFIIPRAMPGDPVTMMFANASVQVTPERIAAMKELLGFVDGPIYIQYFSYIKNILSWELGTSIQFYPLSVNSLLGSAFGWSLFLAGTAVVLSFSIASVLGIFAAWKRGSKYDAFVTPGTLIIQAIPQMVIAMLALFTFAIGLKWFPSGYAYTPGTIPDWTSWEFIKNVGYHAVLPLFCATIVQIGGFLVNMRNNMINLLAEDYITMAKGKGLSENRVVFNYAARNALLPSVTALSMSLGMAIGGQLIIEMIFNYPGLGTVLLNAIHARDYQVLQGQLIIMTMFMLCFNLMADMLYMILDPRLRTGGK